MHAEENATRPKLSWPMLAFHWLLIGFVALLQESLRFDEAGAGPEELLVLVVNRVLRVAATSFVIVVAGYALNPRRAKMRTRLAFTGAGWVVAMFMFYPYIVRS